MARTVHCTKYNKDLPGLDKAPFGGEVGKRIFDTISQQAWKEWQDMQIKILNEYRLNMSDKKDYQFLIDQMMTFLGFNPAGTSVEVENAERGK